MANQPLWIEAVLIPAPAMPAPTPAAPDESLIARIATGDKLAMRALFARHQVRVYRFVLRLVRDPQLAEDLVSEVFVDVWRKVGRFEHRSAASTWLLAIARHKALSESRKRKESQLDEAAAAAIPDERDDPEAEVSKTEQATILRGSLERLSVDHREIIDLTYYQGAGIKAAAEILGIPPNTVKTRMFHARRQLASLLQAAGVERWGSAA